MRNAARVATWGLLAGVFLLLSAGLHPAEAQRGGQSPLVQIESSFLSVESEVFTGLGVNWGGVDGTYSSTGSQPPGSGSSSGAFGSFGLGGNLWFNTGLGETSGGAINTGPLFLGAGIAGTGFFDSTRDILRKSRHHPVTQQTDVVGSQSMNWAADVTGRANIALSFAPRVTPENSIRLEILAGLSVIETETSLRSDQTFFGGTDVTKRSTDVDVAPVLGAAVSKQITTIKVPTLGELPVLGQIFFDTRRIPGTDVSKPSTFGFTEKLKTDAHWSHEAGVRLLIILTPRVIK
jgi:hypothetical protein